MLISLITPTHKPSHLLRLYESLKVQTCKDFEWVIVPNNGADTSFLPQEDWIISVIDTSGNKNIGAIKNFAFKQGKGDWLAEVDHDDTLMPNCIEELIKVAREDICDFIYSDTIDLLPNNKSMLFSSKHGWSHYPFQNDTAEYTINKTFLPTPQSVARIWYAPNHIRVWKKSFYLAVGGHDTTLIALDDEDLLCRTYIHGRMHKIDKVLYIYYYHENNTFSHAETNQWIRDNSDVIYEKYIHSMMRKWCQLNNLLIIDIGKRGTLKPDAQRVDLDTSNLKDDSVGLIFADNCLQLYKHPVELMQKIWKALSHGGMLISNTLSTDGRGAFQDPTYQSYWNANSFWYYTKSNLAAYHGSHLRFQSTFIKDWFPSDYHKDMKLNYVIAHLTALKKDNSFNSAVPGIIEI